ncbi:MAG: trigger factor, partial [Peptococcaceae bacterium]|nr:trigger factor [Peptococcaceae bacterium]
MAVKIESQEKSKVVMEITVDAAEISAVYTRVAKKLAGQINVPGFRKGKAPKHIIKRYVDKEYLDNEVFEQVVRPALVDAYQETGIFPVSTPKVDVVQLEDGKELIFKATVEVKPEVELGQYTGLNIEKKSAEVTDEQVDQELERRQNLHAELVPVEDGEVKEQDIVNIDFEGFKDGEPFEGGKAEGHDLTIGSGSFIPGFEEQLIGAKAGQELEINVRFPDDYHSDDLAGKDAMFKVKINSIKRKRLLPLDDEFAKDISEFDTLAEL